MISLFLTGCQSTVEHVVPSPPLGNYQFTDVGIHKFKSKSRDYDGNFFANALAQRIQEYGYVNENKNSFNKVYGIISASRVEKDSWSKSYKGKKETTYTYYYRVKQTLNVTFSVVRSSKTYVSDTLSFDYDKEFKSYDSYSDAKSDIPSSEKISHILMNRAANSIAKYISPYPTKHKIKLLDGDDDNIGLGNDYVEKKRYQQAFGIYEQTANQAKNNEDQAVAIHNQGMVRLIEGRYKDSFDLVANANRIDPRNMDILDSLELIEKLKVQSDQMKGFKK
jgi:tetratricopeptide (TPR) repeat protein